MFDVEGETESESGGSATEDSRTDSSRGNSDASVDTRGRTKGAYVSDQDESDAEQDDSDDELAKSVEERVKGTSRKRKPPSSLRSPMMIFKAAKKRRPTKESPKSGSVHTKQTRTEKKKSMPTTLGSQSSSPKVNRGYARASFDDKIIDMKKKKNKTNTNAGMDPNQRDMAALTPRQAAAVKYISNLCADKERFRTCVIETRVTSHQSISAIDMKGHTIPRFSDEDDNEKYVCTGVVDSYAGYLSRHITDSRRFNPAWYAFILSSQVQVDRVLQPENRDAYQDFATKFYDHDLRIGIERMTSFARRRSPGLPTNVGTWDIIQPKYWLLKQEDGTSCGLFVLKYMELWDGRRLLRNFTQNDVHIFRMTLIADLIYSPTNERQEHREAVEAIMQASSSR